MVSTPARVAGVFDVSTELDGHERVSRRIQCEKRCCRGEIRNECGIPAGGWRMRCWPRLGCGWRCATSGTRDEGCKKP